MCMSLVIHHSHVFSVSVCITLQVIQGVILCLQWPLCLLEGQKFILSVLLNDSVIVYLSFLI